MSDVIPDKTPSKRRQYSSAFKAKILQACSDPNNSIASVALQHGINANVIHKWRRANTAPRVSHQKSFLPIPFSTPSVGEDVVFELPGLKVRWPLSRIDQAIPWIRSLHT